MGSIIERALGDGTIRYQAMVKIPRQKAAVKTCETREKAQEFIDAVEEMRKLPPPPPPTVESRAKTKFESQFEKDEAWADSWLKETIKEFAKSGKMTDRSKPSIKPILKLSGDVKLGELNEYWQEDYVDRALSTTTRLGKPYSCGSILDHMTIVNAAMRWQAKKLGAKYQRLDSARIFFPEGWDDERERRLEPEEEKMLLRRFMSNPQKKRRQQWIRLFRLALNTGGRLQELVLSDWSEFDLEKRVWTIPRAHTKKKWKRKIPLNKMAMRALKAMLLIRDENSSKVFHAMGDPHNVSGCFYYHKTDLGIEDFRWHDLRHEALSQMAIHEGDLNPVEFMKVSGHKTLKQLDKYVNLRGEELAAKLRR